MNTTNFKSIVTKGNDKGAGFIRLPFQIRANFLVGDQYKVILNSKIQYYSKIRDYSGKGVFIPATINIKNNLCKKEVEIKLQKIDGFYTHVGQDGRIYIPNFYTIKKGDIVLVNLSMNKGEIKSYHRIYSREKTKTKEFLFYTNPIYSNNKAIVKILEIFQKNKIVNSDSTFTNILKEFDFAEVENDKIIVYHGNRLPILIKNNINIKDLAYYLGCYFADGTKRGNDWGICASTFKQANYYQQKHNQIIADAKVICSLSCTVYDVRDIKKLKKKLSSIWSKKINQEIDSKRVRVIKTETKEAPNRNSYGTLIIKEHRQLTQIYYNNLLNCLFNTIAKKHNKELATDFICGVMEGDGCVNSKTHGHVIITTNGKEIKILKDICDKSFLKSSLREWKGKSNRVDLLIGSLGIIKNLIFLKDKLFKYYPKRRKRLIERLLNTGAAKYITGEQKSTSGWIKADLKNTNILNKNFKLTNKGKLIKKCLIEMKKELK